MTPPDAPSPDRPVTGTMDEYHDMVQYARSTSMAVDDSVVLMPMKAMADLAAWAVATGRANAVWPFTFGLACCAIEMMALASSRFDLDRIGSLVFRGSPRQCDLMIVAGTVTYKMGLCVERLWHQMAEPRYVVSMGACATNSGPYSAHGYHVMRGVDLVIPVNVYTPGCPPRPETLLESILTLQKQIKTGQDVEIRRMWERAHRAQAERLKKAAEVSESAPVLVAASAAPQA